MTAGTARKGDVSTGSSQSRSLCNREESQCSCDKEQGTYASAHDLRRAFGTRWSNKLSPAMLQQLMRHSSIDTTLKYYVERNADDMCKELWQGWNALSSKNGSQNSITSPN